MAFTLKTFQQIVDEMIATVKALPGSSTNPKKITDFNRGSVVRTLLEAAALQDADQYAQIGKIRDFFSIDKATGSDLDDRALDYGMTRNQPAQSVGIVVVTDTSITTEYKTYVSTVVLAGATTVLASGGNASAFPSTGTIILDRSSTYIRESAAYTSITNMGGGIYRFNLSAPVVYDHALSTLVVLSQQGTDRVIADGTTLIVPASGSIPIQYARTSAAATFYDGDKTTSVAAVSKFTGTVQNYAIGAITSFSSAPFPTATVTNLVTFSGGTDVETDSAFRTRIKNTVQSLSGGTLRSLITAALGATLPSGQKVASAQTVENPTTREVYLYVDDGFGTISSSSSNMSIELVIANASAGKKYGHIVNWPLMLGTLRLVKSSYDGTTTLITVGVGQATLTDLTATFPALPVTSIFTDANGNSYSVLSNTPTTVTVAWPASMPLPTLGYYSILDPAITLLENTDYVLNSSTGDFALTVALVGGETIAAMPYGASAAYSYYTGLIQLVQRIINGDPNDLTTYPGVKATGAWVRVVAPTLQTLTIDIVVEVNNAVGLDSLIPSIKTAVVNYINNLGIAEDVISAAIVAAVMNIQGVLDVRVLSPPGNLAIADGTLARTSSPNINIL